MTCLPARRDPFAAYPQAYGDLSGPPVLPGRGVPGDGDAVLSPACSPEPPRGWRVEAACRELPTELFFPIGHGPRAQAQAGLAKEVCGGCAVRDECLCYALGANARYGIFGGLDEEERRDVRRRLNGGGFAIEDDDLEESA